MVFSVNLIQSLLWSVETKLANVVTTGSCTALAATETDSEGTTEAGGTSANEAAPDPDGAAEAEAANELEAATDPEAANELEAAAGAGLALARCCDRTKAEMILDVFILKRWSLFSNSVCKYNLFDSSDWR